MVSWDVLSKQDDVATSAVIDALANNDTFVKLSASETKDALDRDNKDAEALKKGIVFAQEKEVLPQIDPAPYAKIDVPGKSADQVADELIAALGAKASEGCVIVLVGLSGTGKGTTVEKLKAKLAKAVAWSNGNMFRCLTLLACEHCEKVGAEIQDVLTPDNLKQWIGNLKFDKFDGKWDTELTRLDGTKVLVSETCNTLLKEPRISKNIPTVASATQGEVVLFAADACTKMGADGSVVIVEGREETVNFIPTPFRFCLTMPDINLIGKRRAAQRVLGQALKDCGKDEDCCQALEKCANALA